jgi:hypothetical protein
LPVAAKCRSKPLLERRPLMHPRGKFAGTPTRFTGTYAFPMPVLAARSRGHLPVRLARSKDGSPELLKQRSAGQHRLVNGIAEDQHRHDRKDRTRPSPNQQSSHSSPAPRKQQRPRRKGASLGDQPRQYANCGKNRSAAPATSGSRLTRVLP